MQRPEPAQILRAAAGFVDAADAPLAAEDTVVHAVFVEAGAEAGRVHLEGHGSHKSFCSPAFDKCMFFGREKGRYSMSRTIPRRSSSLAARQASV
jgi:hypothetical protein